ncbi:MAG: MarC family protein [Pirellulales bacterium]
MSELQQVTSNFVLLWAVIDPIGTVPVFISATRKHSAEERRHIARVAAGAAAGILLFFILVGERMLDAMGVPLLAFQISGGIVLFLFALTMIFGESKPEAEAEDIKKSHDVAIFPLATPSIASPGAMMAVVLMTQRDLHPIDEWIVTTIMMLVVIGAAYGLMLGAGWISRTIGSGGASVVSRVMGMILASVAASEVLEGIKQYFG